MSPEQALGDPVAAPSDVYSFGVVLYQMLTGRLPYQGTTKLSLVRQIVHEPPMPLRIPAPHVPGSLVSIVDRCLVKDPAGRYATAGELHADLRRCAAHLPAGDADPSEAVTRSSPVRSARVRDRRIPLRAVAIAAGFVLLMFVAWARGTSLVRWLRTQATAQAQLSDADAPAPELYSRALEDLRLYYREGNVDRAIARLDRALALRSPYPSAEARLSVAYFRKNGFSGDPEWQKRAKAHAERATAASDQLAIAHIAYGAALTLSGQLDEAAAAYQKAETLEPANWELLWRLGDLAIARKDPAAEQCYRRATVSAPQEWESHARLGAFLYQQGRYPEATASFERMRELAPDHSRAYSSLAAAYHQLGRTDEAARVLQRALEIAPDSLTYSNLGTYLYFQGKYPEAVRAFDEAVRLNANLYLRWGNLADAVRMTAPGSDKMHESYRRAVQLARGELAKRPPIPTSGAVLPCIWSVTARPPLHSPRSIRYCGCRTCRRQSCSKVRSSRSWPVSGRGRSRFSARRSTPATSCARSAPNPTS
jgi:serine/threonine-protein kinase